MTLLDKLVIRELISEGLVFPFDKYFIHLSDVIEFSISEVAKPTKSFYITLAEDLHNLKRKKGGKK